MVSEGPFVEIMFVGHFTDCHISMISYELNLHLLQEMTVNPEASDSQLLG